MCVCVREREREGAAVNFALIYLNYCSIWLFDREAEAKARAKEEYLKKYREGQTVRVEL